MAKALGIAATDGPGSATPFARASSARFDGLKDGGVEENGAGRNERGRRNEFQAPLPRTSRAQRRPSPEFRGKERTWSTMARELAIEFAISPISSDQQEKAPARQSHP